VTTEARNLTAGVQRYGWVAMILHWAVACMIVAQYFIAEAAEELPRGIAQIEMYALHKSMGITVLLLALVRMGWRFIVPPPPPVVMAPWQAGASRMAHWGLYLLLLAMPLSGWLYSSAEAFSVSWWGLVQLPDLVGPSEELADLLHEVHEYGFLALVGLAGLHIAAALKHQFIDRDGALMRMLPAMGRRS